MFNKIKHAEMPLDNFWISIIKEYPNLSKKAIKVLLQFTASWEFFSGSDFFVIDVPRRFKNLKNVPRC